jgi:hypothetical protein
MLPHCLRQTAKRRPWKRAKRSRGKAANRNCSSRAGGVEIIETPVFYSE